MGSAFFFFFFLRKPEKWQFVGRTSGGRVMVLNVVTLSQGGVVLMLFVIYTCHLLISIYCTNYFMGVVLVGVSC